MADETIYIGWIYGDPDDEAQLRELGVKGKMLWKADDNSDSIDPPATQAKKGYFAHCECTEDVLDRLEQYYPAFVRATFSLTNEEEYAAYRREYYG